MEGRGIQLDWGFCARRIEARAGYILKVPRKDTPKYKPNDCHQPPGACVPIEDAVAETNLVQQATDEWTHAESDALSYDEPSGQSSPSTHANDARIRTEALAVHEVGERQTADAATNQDQVEIIGLIC